MNHPHALAAATGRRLDQYRVSDVVSAGDQVGVGEARSRYTGNDGYTERRNRGLRGDLVAHGLDRRDRRPDAYDAGGLKCGSEFGVLREESVSRMDGLGTGALGRRHHRVNIEVALPRGGRPDADGD